MCRLDNGGYNAALARAPAIQGPYPERKATRYSAKLHWYEVHTRKTTRYQRPHEMLGASCCYLDI